MTGKTNRHCLSLSPLIEREREKREREREERELITREQTRTAPLVDWNNPIKQTQLAVCMTIAEITKDGTGEERREAEGRGRFMCHDIVYHQNKQKATRTRNERDTDPPRQWHAEMSVIIYREASHRLKRAALSPPSTRLD